MSISYVTRSDCLAHDQHYRFSLLSQMFFYLCVHQEEKMLLLLYSEVYTPYRQQFSTIKAPFSNGELIAFNEDGKKLWSQKLFTNLFDTPLTDITTTPRVCDNILIAKNNSYIYSIDVKSGNILWSKPLKVKSVSDIESYYSPLIPVKEQKTGGRIFIVTKDNKVIGIDIQSGEVVWKKMQA
uniref:PQQ_3 domain-containing protein n=1 Tax=Brugia timori TaxID=42155 RepID=A0A0R3R1L8_9BILA